MNTKMSAKGVSIHGGKKTLLALGLSAGLLLAPVMVLGVAVAPGAGAGVVAGTSDNNSATALQETVQKMQGYMAKMQAGSLTADEQKDLYKSMTQPAKMMGVSAMPSAFNYKVMSGQPGAMMMYGRDGDIKSFALIFIITVALVWGVLLLLVLVLLKWLKKSKHG